MKLKRLFCRAAASLAQLVARRSHNPKVVSSILTGGIFSNLLRVFRFLCFVFTLSWKAEARLAQLVERKTLNLVVVGSSPTVGAFLVS